MFKTASHGWYAEQRDSEEGRERKGRTSDLVLKNGAEQPAVRLVSAAWRWPGLDMAIHVSSSYYFPPYLSTPHFPLIFPYPPAIAASPFVPTTSPLRLKRINPKSLPV